MTTTGSTGKSGGHRWVTKIDVTSYDRCAYAWWLVDTGKLSRDDALGPFYRELADRGAVFETSAVATTDVAVLAPGAERELLLDEQRPVRPQQTLINERLGLRGRPDLIIGADGRAEPVEIKSHRRVQASDKLELAFYWRLLIPMRSVSSEPAGWVYLRAADGTVNQQRVIITDDVFARLNELIVAVRVARLRGGVPRRHYCRCNVCGGIRRDEVLARALHDQDISSIFDVGKARSQALRRAGIHTWPDLLASPAEEIASTLQHVLPPKTTATTTAVRGWQAHARALLGGDAEWVDGPVPFPVDRNYIVVDLEYTPETKDVWLIGARAIDPARGDVAFSAWSDRTGERQAILALRDLLDRFPSLTVVTYNGLSADLPMLRAAAERCDSDVVDLLEGDGRRHLDLYHWLKQALRLPIPDLGLKDVADWAGLRRASPVTGGLHAARHYRQYQRSGDPAIRSELIDYCHDDVANLAGLVERLRHLTHHSAAVKPLGHVRETIEAIHETPPPRRAERHGLRRRGLPKPYTGDRPWLHRTATSQ